MVGPKLLLEEPNRSRLSDLKNVESRVPRAEISSSRIEVSDLTSLLWHVKKAGTAALCQLLSMKCIRVPD